MLKDVILKTEEMFDNYNPDEKDFALWKGIAQYMNGEAALVIDCFGEENGYVFIGLKNEIKDKELAYMMEQDSNTGSYINDREGFNAVWEAGEYNSDVSFCIDAKYLTFDNQRRRNDLSIK